MAHEYCHLARGHHEDGIADEAEANAFAAELLLPADVMLGIDWNAITAADLASFIWERGVSTDALARRLQALGLARSSTVDSLLAKRTQGLLRHHWIQPEDEPGDAITLRMDAAAARRFPLIVQDAHLTLIAEGRVGKSSLAWMLGVPPEDLDVEVPAPSQIEVQTVLRDLERSMPAEPM